VRQNLLAVPDGVDIVTFLRHDGRPPLPQQPGPRHDVTLAALRDEYVGAHRSALEPNTLATVGMHFRHLAGFFGERAKVQGLTLAGLQRYVGSRERKVQAATIRMEVVSLRTAWNWGVRSGLCAGPFPGAGLRYPKAEEKLPFMTWPEVERRLRLGG